jgi:hypothetical protein
MIIEIKRNNNRYKKFFVGNECYVVLNIIFSYNVSIYYSSEEEKMGFWHKRTKLENCLIVSTFLFLLLSIGLLVGLIVVKNQSKFILFFIIFQANKSK